MGYVIAITHVKRRMGGYPIVPGHEVVGEVIKIGSDVNQFKVGDRVGIPWDRSGCGYCSTIGKYKTLWFIV